MNYFRTILYFPANNKLLVLIFVAWMLPQTNGELVYDCTNQRNPVHAFSLEDVKPCPKFKEQYGKGIDQRVQIISKSTQRYIKATKVRYLFRILLPLCTLCQPLIIILAKNLQIRPRTMPNLDLFVAFFRKKYSQPFFFHVAVPGHDQPRSLLLRQRLFDKLWLRAH